jgi:hypothetical protein
MRVTMSRRHGQFEKLLRLIVAFIFFAGFVTGSALTWLASVLRG